ncbi:MAG: hypothetical protein RLZZ347_129 [Candidatus Parcubacteria bacterium]|jgi:hypothetical protein
MHAKVVLAPGSLLENHPHPLKGQDIGYAGDFAVFLDLWYATPDCERRLGLLHSLTLEHEYDRREVIPFLLLVADGFKDLENFRDPTKKFQPLSTESKRLRGMSYAERQRILAKKAFAILCDQLFAEDKENHHYSHDVTRRFKWWWILNDSPMFDLVLNFFPVDDRYGNLRNGYRTDTSESKSRQAEIVSSFLFEFAQAGWKFTRFGDRWCDEDEAIKARLVTARPRFIEILDYLNQVSWLIGRQLDPESVKKLTELALGREIRLPQEKVGCENRRKPKTLEEALLGHSPAAEVLILDAISDTAVARFQASYNASVVEQEAETRQRQLEALAKQQQDLAAQVAELAGA